MKSLAEVRQMDDEDKRSYWTLLAAAGNISVMFAANLLVGVLAGRAIDGWLDSRPWATAAGALLGFSSAMWSVAKLVIKDKKGKMRHR